MHFLITGEEGNIKSTVADMFIDQGLEVTLIDNQINEYLSKIRKKSRLKKKHLTDNLL